MSRGAPDATWKGTVQGTGVISASSISDAYRRQKWALRQLSIAVSWSNGYRALSRDYGEVRHCADLSLLT